jgi:hypothetical protein
MCKMSSPALRKMLLPSLSALILLASLPACSASEKPDSTPLVSPSGGLAPPSVGHSMPPIMGIALDPAGAAIPLASMGEEIGDFNGVISGDLEVSPAGWLTVHAFGYATGFARPFGGGEATPRLFEARLTPFTAGTTFTGETEETLTILDDETLSIEITLEADSFNHVPVTVMIAVIDRLDIEASYQETDANEDLNLHHAFAVQAFDADFNEVQLPPGATISATITLPIELGGDVLLAAFDPVAGGWASLSDACSHVDPITYDCYLDRLSPLFGLFHQSEVIRDEIAQTQVEGDNPASSAGGTLMSPARAENSIEGSQWDNQFKLAWDRITEWLSSHEKEMWFGTFDEDLDDPVLQDLLDDLIDAAIEFAAGNRNEAGKLHLMKAAEAAAWLGVDQLGYPANNEAAQIAYEMGEEILKDPDCGKFQEANKIAENNSMISGLPGTSAVDNAGMAAEIWQTYDKLIADCDVWTGTITLRLPTMIVHPVEDFSRESGSSEWWEMHQIQISTNVKTFASRAEDHVHLMFLPVNYTAPQFECPNEITYSSSQPGRLFLTASGSFDGYEFVLGKLTPHPDSSPGTVTQSWNFQSKYGDPPSCRPDAGGQQSFQLRFYSLLAHGFIGETPAITLQEMLDGWEVGSDVIQGSRAIANPEPDTGNIPVAGGSVTWNLHHDQAMLPLPE